MRIAVRTIILASLALAPACSHPPGNSLAPAPARARIEMLTMAEVGQASNFSNVYDMLSQQRPRWLEPRVAEGSTQTPGNVMVRVGDVEYGPVESLRSLGSGSILSIQFFDPATAVSRWGNNYAHGAILIKYRPMVQ